MNPEKPLSPEDTARLKILGHDRVMSDLRAKYSLGKATGESVASATGPSIMPEKTWQTLIDRRNAFLKSLEGLPTETHIILPDEMVGLMRIKQILDTFLADHEKYRKLSDREALWKLVEILDRVSLWTSKYATESTGGVSTDVPLQPYDPEMNSIYYTAPSGATLRLKTTQLHDGRDLRAVVQPITEKVVFQGPDGEMSESPRAGWSVREYYSPSFLAAFRESAAHKYEPGLRIYREGELVAAISHISGTTTGQEVFSADHDGDRVNKIFMSR